jgi:hypothetical protein
VVKLVLDPARGVPTIREYLFLPDKDFVLKQLKLTFYSRRPYSQKPGILTVIDVQECKQMDSVWVPTKVLDERKFYRKDGSLELHNRIVGELKDCSWNKPTDEEMTVGFPPGVVVTDVTARQVYEVLPDGSKKQLEFYDSDTGQVVTPEKTQP